MRSSSTCSTTRSLSSTFLTTSTTASTASRKFQRQRKAHAGRIWDTNFIADARNFKLEEWKERGGGGTNVMLEMANGSMAAHISEFPIGTYKKAHRHGPGFNVIIIKERLLSLLERGDSPKRYDWQDAGLTPPPMMFHQHFNTGATPARYLPPRLGGIKYSLGEQFGDVTKVDKDVKAGGNQIEYSDEDQRSARCSRKSCEVRHLVADEP